MSKEEFISKWRNFWLFQGNEKELTIAFEKELEELIKNEILKQKLLLKTFL